MKSTQFIPGIFALCLGSCSHTEQQILDAGGPQARLVVRKAHEELAATKVFEYPDVGWGTPSASCWALTVLVRYDREGASETFNQVFGHSDKPYMRLYALLGMHLLDPKNPRLDPFSQPKSFLQQQLSVANGCTLGPNTVEGVLRELRQSGGYECLLYKAPLPRLYETRHPPP